MSDSRVVLLLLALCPGLGLARSSAPVSPPLVEVEDAPEPAPERDVTVEAPTPPPVTQTAKAEAPVPVGGRVFVESLAGTLAGVGGAFVGLLGTAVVSGGAGSCVGGNCKPVVPVGGALVGFSLGAAIGVYASGSKLGGQGRGLPTLVLGLLSGGAATALYASDSVGDATIPLLLALPLITTVMTYELTGAWAPAAPGERAAARDTGAWWTPTVGVSGRGASLGLAGQF